MSAAVKLCRVCGEVKFLTAFYRQPDRGDGYANRCKACVKVADAARRPRRGYNRQPAAMRPRLGLPAWADSIACCDAGTFGEWWTAAMNPAARKAGHTSVNLDTFCGDSTAAWCHWHRLAGRCCRAEVDWAGVDARQAAERQTEAVGA